MATDRILIDNIFLINLIICCNVFVSTHKVWTNCYGASPVLLIIPNFYFQDVIVCL